MPLTEEAIDDIVNETDFDSELDNTDGLQHAIDSCYRHAGKSKLGDLVITACGKFMAWATGNQRCELCEKTTDPTCHICGVPLVQ